MEQTFGGRLRGYRKGKHLTQQELAERIGVSDKTVSRWESGRGLPDLALLEPLGAALGVSVAELLSGECVTNRNRAGNPLRGRFYVCPVCGNVIHAMGEGSFHCCGVAPPPLEAEVPDETHELTAEDVDGEYYVSLAHPMEKGHFISFLALVGPSRLEIVKLYPEQEAAARFSKRGGGILYACCNRHGLFCRKL